MPCISSSGSWQCTSVGDIFWSDLRPLRTTLPLFKPHSLPMSNMSSCVKPVCSLLQVFFNLLLFFFLIFPPSCAFVFSFGNTFFFRTMDCSATTLGCAHCLVQRLLIALKLASLLARTVEIPVEILRETHRECRGGQKKKKRDDSREYWRKYKIISYKLHLPFLIMWKAQSLMNKVEKQHWQFRGNVR